MTKTSTHGLSNCAVKARSVPDPERTAHNGSLTTIGRDTRVGSLAAPKSTASADDSALRQNMFMRSST
jgi:hypothetical protein